MIKTVRFFCKKLIYGSIALGALVTLSACSSKTVFNNNFNSDLITPTELSEHSANKNKENNNKSARENITQNSESPKSKIPSKSSVMSLASVALYALDNNPNIDIARWQAKSAEADVELANVKWRPKIEYSFRAGPEITYDSKTNTSENHTRREASITLSQLIFDFGKTNADVDWAEAAQNSAKMRLAHKIISTIYEVAEIYLMVLEQDLLIANARKNEKTHEETYRLVKISEAGGNATQADVQKAYTRLEGARTQTIELISARQRTASEFRRVVGFDPGKLKLPQISKNMNVSLDPKQIDIYIKQNYFMRSLLQDIVGLRHQQAALERGYLPQLTLEGSANAKENVTGVNPMTADARITVALRGFLYDGGDKYAKILKVKAKIGEKEARYRKAQLDLENEVAENIRILRTAKSKSSLIDKRIKASEEVVRLYTEQFKSGSRNIFELLDAQQELSIARAEKISNRFDILRAQFNAQKYNGTLLKNIFGENTPN